MDKLNDYMGLKINDEEKAEIITFFKAIDKNAEMSSIVRFALNYLVKKIQKDGIFKVLEEIK